MRILMVWDGNYPWDVRVEKILRTLNSWGHETHLVCRNSGAKLDYELHDGTVLHRLFAFKHGFFRKLNPLINFPAFFSPFWLRRIQRAIREVRPDVIIIRDLPIAPAVVPLAKRAKIPTILDMAECYPELIRCVWKFDSFSPANLLVRNPLFADMVEKYVIRNVNLIWVMIEESAQRLIEKGISRERIVKVSNTPAAANLQIDSASKTEGPRLEIVYVGLVNPSRGVSTVVQAAEILRSRGLNFRIKIVGNGKELKKITRMVEASALEGVVEMAGWIDRTEVQGILDLSDIGLVPHFDCSHWNNTIPNKLFDYMKARIPVIVSNAKPAERIVTRTGCGLVFSSGDAEDLANQIMRLSDPAARAVMGRAGVEAVLTEYNWESDSARLKESMLQLIAST